MDDKLFDNFYSYKGFGPAIKSQQIPDSAFLRHRGYLPKKLLEYWSIYGWAGYAEGLFWLVDPEEYHPVVNAWLRGTPFESADNYFLVARSALGRLYLWGEDTGPSLEIVAPYAFLFPRDCSEKLAQRGQDKQLQLFFSTKDKEGVDLNDDNEKPLFQRALAKIGPLESDEMYGFVPALALGGPNRVENLQKVKAVEHLVMLADLGERKIMADIVKLARDSGLM